MDWIDIAKQVAEQALPFLELVISLAVAVALRYAAKRWHLDLSDKEQSQLVGHAQRAIAGAEEWAARELTPDQTTEDATRGKAKARWALAILRKRYPKMLEEDAMDLIDIELANLRGVGATGDFSVKDNESTSTDRKTNEVVE